MLLVHPTSIPWCFSLCSPLHNLWRLLCFLLLCLLLSQVMKDQELITELSAKEEELQKQLQVQGS